MGSYRFTLGQTVYRFEDLKTLLAKATPARSGDELAGIAARSPEERVAAQMALADLPLTTFLSEPVVPYDKDQVTRLIVEGFSCGGACRFSAWTGFAVAFRGGRRD